MEISWLAVNPDGTPVIMEPPNERHNYVTMVCRNLRPLQRPTRSPGLIPKGVPPTEAHQYAGDFTRPRRQIGVL